MSVLDDDDRAWLRNEIREAVRHVLVEAVPHDDGFDDDHSVIQWLRLILTRSHHNADILDVLRSAIVDIDAGDGHTGASGET